MLVYILLAIFVIAHMSCEKLLKKRAIIGKENISGEGFSPFVDALFERKVLILFVMLFLFTFKAVGVGMDTKNYFDYYESLRLGEERLFQTDGGGFEIGYVFLNSILALMNLDFLFLQLAIAIITLGCFFVFIKYFSCDETLSWFLFISLGLYAQSFSAYRQIIAISLVAVALVTLMKNKLLPTLFLIFLAFFFHKSAIVCLLFVLVKFLKLNWKTLIVFLALTVFTIFAFVPIMQFLDSLLGVNYYEKYFVLNQVFNEPTRMLDILYTIGLFFVVAVFYGFKNNLVLSENQRKVYDFFLIVFFMVPLIRIVGFALGYQTLLNRVTMYFFFALVVLIPLFVEGLREKSFYRFMLPSVLLGAGVFMYYLYAVKLSCGVVPYVFVWA